MSQFEILNQFKKKYNEDQRAHALYLLKNMRDLLLIVSRRLPENHPFVSIYWRQLDTFYSVEGFHSSQDRNATAAILKSALTKREHDFIAEWVNIADKCGLIYWSDEIGLHNRKPVFKMKNCIVRNASMDNMSISYMANDYSIY